MLYTYAVAEGLGDIADLTGVENEPLLLIPFAEAQVVAGEVNARPSLDPATLRAQDALVRALHERARALLPMRFGTTSNDRTALLRAIDAQGDLVARLAAVRGCEQMVVRVLGTSATAHEPVPATVATGTDYLHALAARHRPAPTLEVFAAGLAELAKAVKIESSSQPGLLGAVYHLIERGHATDYRHAVDQLAREHPDLRVLVSGPSPPYAFA